MRSTKTSLILAVALGVGAGAVPSWSAVTGVSPAPRAMATGAARSP